MAMKYKKFFLPKSYTIVDVKKQIFVLNQCFDVISYSIKSGCFSVIISLRPTPNSRVYKIELKGRLNSERVKIFVINPHINEKHDGKKVPHRYKDGSLCLYYPDYNEWNYKDLWADTLIPWTSLWLYYYELWLQTGEWLGGGIHGTISNKDQKLNQQFINKF